ncbi:MAG TPA: hypothetical protein VFA33_17075 [Bryobacteraceae bacterium]|nr:hypothetical protein [Bryobacteraceae bacterium]
MEIRYWTMLGCALLAGVLAGNPLLAAGPNPHWKERLRELIPLYGHRNWIVVADSAYPEQAREGIETIVSGAGQAEVLKTVLESLSAAKHVRPIVYTDAELRYVPEQEAPGVSAYRQMLAGLFSAQKPRQLPHEQIIARLDEAAKTFRVLILKTNLTIPYTSVFLQLDCGYWSADSEQRLRAAMKGHAGK